MLTYRLLFLNLFIFLLYTDSSSFQMFAARRDEVYVYFFLTCNVQCRCLEGFHSWHRRHQNFRITQLSYFLNCSNQILGEGDLSF